MKWKPLRSERKFFFPVHLIFSCLRHFVTRLKLISFCLHFLIFVPDFFKSYLHQKYFCLAHWTVRKKVEMFFPWKCHLNHIVILAGTPKGSQGLNRPLDFFIFTFWWTLGWIRSKRPSLAGEYQKIIGHYYYAGRSAHFAFYQTIFSFFHTTKVSRTLPKGKWMFEVGKSLKIWTNLI